MWALMMHETGRVNGSAYLFKTRWLELNEWLINIELSFDDTVYEFRGIVPARFDHPDDHALSYQSSHHI